MKLWNELKKAMLANPTQLLCEGEVYMTYSEAVAYAEQFSHRIVGNPCCAIFCQSELTAALSLLACFAADVTAVPVSSRYGEAHCQKILSAISPSAVISDRDGQHDVVQKSHSSYLPPSEHPALIMCTSGTT
ncbi:MAG: AMP-binding protein, partial [Clostridia bacterium]|nr:AMP-binding protein [Clostridia bacterium]